MDRTEGGTQRLRVLIVDDIQENLDLLEDILIERGFDCTTTRSANEALGILKKEDVHLVVADAMMPKVDGFQLCKEVRAIPRFASLPFIIYSGNYIDETDEEFARSIGVDRYVVKFAGGGALMEAVDELAQQRYGVRPPGGGEPAPLLDDHAFLEGHHALVIKKLEQKMNELELYAETLERKNRELQASEARYRALFENASIPIFVIDRESGRIADANAQAAGLLGVPPAQVLGMGRLPFAEESEFTRGLLETRSVCEGEAVLRRPDGDRLEVEIGAAPVARPQDPRLLLYVKDITEQKKMREQLLQAEKLSIMGRLAAGIAHEVRNPLAAITLNLQYLGSKISPDLAVSESIRDALEGAKRVESVIENTLSLARVTPPVLRPEEPNAVIRQALSFAGMGLRQRGVQIVEDLTEPLPSIVADARQIQQVLLNILQNAIDASPADGVVTVRSCIGDEPFEKMPIPFVLVTIQDEGPGIPQEQRKSLFQQFKTTKPGGTGLGLVLSRQIMDRHRGAITLENAPGGGAIARLGFPIERQEWR